MVSDRHAQLISGRLTGPCFIAEMVDTRLSLQYLWSRHRLALPHTLVMQSRLQRGIWGEKMRRDLAGVMPA